MSPPMGATAGGYNQRLFAGGLRTRLHLARFYWLARTVRDLALPQASVLELGCFDGRAIEFLPQPPSRYAGYDANWEGGLDLARVKWRSEPKFQFHLVKSPEEICLRADERFDLAISLETLEHVPPEMLGAYLRVIAAHLDGYFLVSVPNEKGLVFLLKWMVKTILGLQDDRYSVADVVNATLGRVSRIRRDEHKGFDYVKFIREFETYFDVVATCGLPIRLLPPMFNFGIGIVGRSKRRAGGSSPHGSGDQASR